MHDDKQLEAVEEIAFHAIDLQVLSAKGQKSRAYQGHRVLTNIHHSEGERGDVVHHLDAAHEVASSLDKVNKLFWVHFSLAVVFSEEHGFGDLMFTLNFPGLTRSMTHTL